jgi:copper chaperone CopZ
MEKTLKVNGMMCAHCQQHVHDALAAMEGVSKVDVNLEAGTAHVVAGREISNAEFKKVIADAGYEMAD